MRKLRSQSGFTAVELLITLFVAAAFLIAAYQLFNVVIKDGGNARAESRAGNLAYDYMRRYTPSATSPCSFQTPLTNAPITTDGLTNTKVTVAITCPAYSTTDISKVDVTVTYNTPTQTVKYSTLTTGSGVALADITNGLVAWWKLNGDVTDASGSGNNGTATNTSTANGQNGAAAAAMGFDGASSQVVAVDSATLSQTATITVSVWANPTGVNGSVQGVVSKDISSGFSNPPYAIQVSTSGFSWYIENQANSGSVTVTCTEVPPTNGSWYFVVGVFDNGAMRMYVNGTQCADTGTQPNIADSTGPLRIGQQKDTFGRWFQGSVDDVRIYNRVLSSAEVTTLYSNGAQ